MRVKYCIRYSKQEYEKSEQSEYSGEEEDSVSSEKKDAKYDWRSNLHSAFVDNLSLRVSKGALWDAFCEYGRVVDVYIHRLFWGNNNKGVIVIFNHF